MLLSCHTPKKFIFFFVVFTKIEVDVDVELTTMNTSHEIPMLVTVYDERKFDSYGKWYVQRKYDGWRILYKEGQFFTKNGIVFSVDTSISDFLRNLQNVVLDGEIVTENDVQKYFVFDCPHVKSTYDVRFEWLTKNIVQNDNVVIAETICVANSFQSKQRIDEFYEHVLLSGGEGIVYKPANLRYVFSSRSSICMKRKPLDIDVVTVIEYCRSDNAIEKKKPSSYVSSYIVRKKDILGKDQIFKVSARTFAPVPLFTEIKIKYSHYTANGVPKFPKIVDFDLQKRSNDTVVREIKTTLHNDEKIRVTCAKTHRIHTVAKNKHGQLWCSCASYRFEKTCEHILPFL